MNAGLILAGGKGERLTGYDRPKQFIEVGGKLLIEYCLQAFKQCSAIALICIVAAEEYRQSLGDCICADPGKSRQHSVYSGLKALRMYGPERVVIHDAARPLVTAADIRGVISAAMGFDGAMPALPVTDTIYHSADGKTITATLNRDVLFAGQTPECYDFRKYLEIHERLTDDALAGIRGSSEAAVDKGMRIAIYRGNEGNFKVTGEEDLERFRAIVERSGRL
jgi:2-C-methyl-D-erythritol 4-phosphate cytidylyltransferase